MAVKIVENVLYKTACGNIVGPFKYNPQCDPYVWQDVRTGLSYTSDGKFLSVCDGPSDIIEEILVGGKHAA